MLRGVRGWGAPTSGDGTKASPFKTLGEAAKAGRARIFVCAGSYSESETLVLEGGVALYGGFGDCPPDGDWLWETGKRAELSGPLDMPAVKVSMGQSRIEGVSVTAPGATVANGSSIALVVEGAMLDLAEVTLTSGKGAAGDNGVAPMGDAVSGAPADTMSATPACLLGTIAGGLGGVTGCDGVDTSGGKGEKGARWGT
ncbi:MAG: DUF1565 domain-containing protein [Polyangiaceae bacterium]